MNMNENIIMAIQGPNILRSMNQGTIAASNARELNRANALDSLYAEHGAGIMAGDQNALNAYAALDPQAALGVQQAHQQMAISQERLDLARAAGSREAERYSRELNAEEAAREAAETDRELATLLSAYQAGPEAWTSATGALGEEYAGVPFESAELFLQTQRAVLDGFQETAERVFSQAEASAEPAAMQTLRLRAAEAGLEPGTAEYQQFMLNSGRQQRGTQLTVGPDGTIQFSDGAIQDNAPVTADPLDPMPTMLEDIGRAIDLIEANPALTTGIGGATTNSIPGTPARDVSALIDTIRANVGFASLQRMRDNSPTGGALGQVTERELALLQATLGNLDQAQSSEQVLYNLQRLEEQINEYVHGHPQGAEAAREQQARGWPLNGTVVDGFRYLGGDPTEQSNWEMVPTQ